MDAGQTIEVTQPSPNKRCYKRSWSGCTRCKKWRQKCDEGAPTCSRCQNAGEKCIYQTSLRWGGRTFRHSRFGSVLADTGNDVVKLNVGTNGFVYTVGSSEACTFSPLPVAEKRAGDITPSNSELFLYLTSGREALNLPRHPTPSGLDFSRSLSSMDRALLHHYVSHVSNATSCHSLMQHDDCQLIIPMALENSALLPATMALSAIHRKSLTPEGLDGYDADKLIAGLKATSLHRLRRELDRAGEDGNTNSLIATIRTLCLCEIYAGRDRPGTWRAHFEGARALIIAFKSPKNPALSDHDGSAPFLRRWFGVTEDMVALTADAFLEDKVDDGGDFDFLTVGTSTEPVYLDEYTGCSTDLSLLFRKIGGAARQRHRASDITNDWEKFGDNNMASQADVLEKSLQRMIDRDKFQPLKFHSRVANLLSAQQAREFYLCNKAYQHTASIQIERRVRNLPACSPIVQSSVKRILQCISSIKFASPSPLAGLTTPLFTVGCEALGADRDLVRQLLRDMFKLMRIPNMRRSSELLEEYWASAQCKHDEGWEFFMRMALTRCHLLTRSISDKSRGAKMGLLALLRTSAPSRHECAPRTGS